MSGRFSRLLAAASSIAVTVPACVAADGPAVAGSNAREAAAASPPPGPQGLIKHVLILVQENRTPDNLFHGLPGADIANQGTDSHGHVVSMQPVDLAGKFDLGHRHQEFLVEYNAGNMNGWDLNDVRCRHGKKCAPPEPEFMYVRPEQVQPYFDLAAQYTFGDRMFQSNQGPSYPAHQYIIAGTSRPFDTGPYRDYLVSGNPDGKPTGCVDAPDSETVGLISPQGRQNVAIYPCFEHQTLMDLLDEAGHTWKYYTPKADGIWTGPNSIDHLRTGPDWQHVIVPQTRVLQDIANRTLADVSWVIPSTTASDHPLGNDGSGPSWIASIVNAVGASPYWSDTAILITWDDWGGWFDHVAPPVHSAYESGFRVPLLVVSPYAKPGYVSHVTHDFGSLLRFIEEAYGLPSLGYEDAQSDDLSDCFDFTQIPGGFRRIATRHDAAWFIRRAATQPDEGPDDE